MESINTNHRSKVLTSTLDDSKDNLKVSYFKSPKATKKLKDIYINEYLAIISDPAKEPEAEKLRDLPLADYRKAKLLQPCITGSGTTGQGRAIETKNGLAVIDFDKLPECFKDWQDFKTALTKDPFSFIVHYSLSGRGICVFVKVPKDNNFKDVYLSFAEYYQLMYDAEIDFLADETRLRFIAYDPAPFYNVSSRIYTDTFPAESATTKELEALDRFAIMTATDPATVFNNSGLAGANLITSFLEERGWNIKNGTGKEAFICTRPGGQDRSLVILNNGDVFMVSVISPNTGIAGVEADKVYNFFEFYKKLSGLDDYEAQKELSKQAFGAFNEAKPMKPNGKESYSLILDYLAKEGIRLNQLTGVIEIGGLPLNDFHISSMLTELSLYSGKNQSKDILLSCLDVIANGNQYHPFLAFVKELENLEPTEFLDYDELDKFIDCFTSGTPKKLIRIYFIRWMLGLFDIHLNRKMTKNVLVVSGAQNSGKTSLAKNILPDNLKQYGKVIDFNMNKMTDSKIALCSFLVACFDEFEEILSKHRTLSEFKNLTSSYDIFERRPFRRNHEQMYRASIAMATTNEKQILTDSTGNTRFLTLDVQAFDLNKYFKIDLMKLWRVIYDYYLQGETSVLNEAERVLQAAENVEFEAVDPYSEMIEKVFKYDPKGFLTSTDVMQQLERETRQNLSINRIGQALKKQGIERISKRVKGSPKYGYALAVRFE